MLKALFIVSAYIVVLLSTNYVAEGDYWESEFYTLLVSSVLGMVVMASSPRPDRRSSWRSSCCRSRPTCWPAWRKGDLKSNEAGMKYYLMGVFASAVLLYGMSLVYGVGGSTRLDRHRRGAREHRRRAGVPIVTLAMIFVIVGFAFKVSAVPFHVWAPDTYEGAPTPVTAFLAVASKAAGFVALIKIVFFCFAARPDIIQPVFFVLSVASMTVGNLIALRQTNVVRMLAYSGIAQAGFMLAPFAWSRQQGVQALQAIVIYLVIYAAMNLGAFAVVIAVARKTRSAEIDSFGGLFTYMPGADGGDDALPRLAHRHPAARWLVRQVRRVQGARRGQHRHVGIRPRDHHGGQHRDRGVLLPAGGPGDVVRGGARRPTPRRSAVPSGLIAAIGAVVTATLLFGVLPGPAERRHDLRSARPRALTSASR